MGFDNLSNVVLVYYSFQLMLLILLFNINLSISTQTNHASGVESTTLAANDRDKGIIYIVYLGHHKHKDKDLIIKEHMELLSLAKGSMETAIESIIYHYKHSFSGFAAVLTIDEANQLSRMEEVVSVFPSKELKLETTRSWSFVGLVNPTGINGTIDSNNNTTTMYSSELWDLAKEGQDVIIGVVDSGIWPESESFNDDGMEEVPPNIWRGECEEGVGFSKSNCNKKIIGAKSFWKGYETRNGPVETAKENFKSVRDAVGHGTHAAAIAAGRTVANVSGYGHIAQGTATGGFPLARLAIYKPCWFVYEESQNKTFPTCEEADVFEAIDTAVMDGVHILSVSLGSPGAEMEGFENQALTVAALHAMQAGILLSTTAGNRGPAQYSVGSMAPWLISSAATSTDRIFVASLRLVSRNRTIVQGQSITPFDGIQSKKYRLVRGRSILHNRLPEATKERAIERECGVPDTLDPAKVKNAIVFCLASPFVTPVQQSLIVKRAGGLAMISGELHYYENPGVHIMKVTEVPTIYVALDASLTIQNYISTRLRPNSNARILPLETTFEANPSPIVAIFSSQGPNRLVPSILKPDISAPEVNILSAWSGAMGPSGQLSDNRITEYNILSGTSMACPHVSALAALLKSIHPSWSPSAIKSAIMTTASHVDNTGERIKGYEINLLDNFISLVEANPFLVGAGQIDPKRATDPGLLYDATLDDYYKFLCNIGYSESTIRKMADNDHVKCPEHLGRANELNQPYVVVYLAIGRSTTLIRKVTNVGGNNSTYHAIISTPVSTEIEIQPKVLRFNRIGQMLRFYLQISRISSFDEKFHFGSLTWEEVHGDHRVTIPIIVGI